MPERRTRVQRLRECSVSASTAQVPPGHGTGWSTGSSAGVPSVVSLTTAIGLPSMQDWIEQFRTLRPTCDIATAARLLGIGRTTAFALIKDGQFPVEVIRMGRVRRVRTGDLLAYLHIVLPAAPHAAIAPGPATAGLPGGPHVAGEGRAA